jgi:hypothetical protein
MTQGTMEAEIGVEMLCKRISRSVIQVNHEARERFDQDGDMRKHSGCLIFLSLQNGAANDGTAQAWILQDL